MTRKQILLHYAGTRVEDLPGDIRNRVESDPKLLSEVEAQARVAGLMSLKKHEKPDETMDGRVRDRVRVRILNGETAPPVYGFELMPDWARMVAVVVVMLALSLITHREMLGEPSPPAATVAGEVRDLTAPPPEQDLQFNTVDPFTTYVLNPSDSGSGDYLNTVFNPRLEEPYLDLLPAETNRLDGATSLLPVRYSPSR